MAHTFHIIKKGGTRLPGHHWPQALDFEAVRGATVWEVWFYDSETNPRCVAKIDMAGFESCARVFDFVVDTVARELDDANARGDFDIPAPRPVLCIGDGFGPRLPGVCYV